MYSYTISRSRFLCAQSRRNRAAFEHVIATTRQVIRDSQRLIGQTERASDNRVTSKDHSPRSEQNTGKSRKLA